MAIAVIIEALHIFEFIIVNSTQVPLHTHVCCQECFGPHFVEALKKPCEASGQSDRRISRTLEMLHRAGFSFGATVSGVQAGKPADGLARQQNALVCCS